MTSQPVVLVQKMRNTSEIFFYTTHILTVALVKKNSVITSLLTQVI